MMPLQIRYTTICLALPFLLMSSAGTLAAVEPLALSQARGLAEEQRKGADATALEIQGAEYNFDLGRNADGLVEAGLRGAADGLQRVVIEGDFRSKVAAMAYERPEREQMVVPLHHLQRTGEGGQRIRRITAIDSDGSYVDSSVNEDGALQTVWYSSEDGEVQGGEVPVPLGLAERMLDTVSDIEAGRTRVATFRIAGVPVDFRMSLESQERLVLTVIRQAPVVRALVSDGSPSLPSGVGYYITFGGDGSYVVTVVGEDGSVEHTFHDPDGENGALGGGGGGIGLPGDPGFSDFPSDTDPILFEPDPNPDSVSPSAP